MDVTNRNTALASALVEELARCGMRRAVVAPGSRSTPLALALWRAPAIEVTVIVDERSAGYFAVGAAQATATPVAVLCTSGTAAANLHPAVCEANESAVPLLVLTADRPPELRDIGAGQTIDQLKLYGEAVRWFSEVGTHEADDAGLLHMRSTACRAYAAARGDPRPGPVHLNLAWRDPLGPDPRAGDVTAGSELALAGRGERPLTVVATALPVADEALVTELAERIASTPRGLILAGRQPDPDLAAPVTALAEATGYPLLAEPTSQLRLGAHDRDRVISSYEAVARLRPAELAPEVVVRFGELPTCKPLRQWLEAIGGARQIIVDPHHGWNEPSRRAATMVRTAPATLAAGLATRLSGADIRGAAAEPSWSASWFAAAAAAAAAIDRELEAIDGPTEPHVHRALGALYSDGDLVYTASSMPIRDQEAFLPTGAAQARFLCNRGANGIDGLLSSGLGAAAATRRPTWIVTGDLGLFHDMNGLASAAAAPGPLRIVVLDNGGGGIFEFLPQAEQLARDEFEALFGTPVPIALERVAALYGLAHERIDRLDRLAAAADTERVLIEIPVDRRGNVEIHRRIAKAAVEDVERALNRSKEEAR